MSKIRLLLTTAIAALALVFVIQNTEVVSVKFLWLDLAMSRAILVVVLLGAGFAIGWLSGRMRRSRRRQPVPGDGSEAP